MFGRIADRTFSASVAKPLEPGTVAVLEALEGALEFLNIPKC